MTEHLTREHLTGCREVDTIRIPDGWTRPPGALSAFGSVARDIAPGWYLEHDGGDDSIPWRLLDASGNSRLYVGADDVEALQVPVDALERADEDEDGSPTPIVTDAAPEGTPIGGDFSDDAWGAAPADEDETTGTVTVEVVPDVTGFVDKLHEALAGESVALPVTMDPRLDEWQHERVAALENALRILESRRAPSGGADGALGNLFRKPADVPMVGKRDLIDVAAFIASEDTGRTEVQA